MGPYSHQLIKGKDYLLAWLYAIVGSIFLALAAYPGFMSYDSLQMVREARTSVVGGPYPTLPVYIFRLFDIFGEGNAFQFLTQNMIILLCLNLIMSRLRVSWVFVLIANVVVLSNPLTMGAMLVLWKDVTLLAIALITLLTLVWNQTSLTKTKSPAVTKWLVLFAIFLLGAMRLNALPLALGLFAYWTFVYYPHFLARTKFALVSALTISSFLFTGLLQTVGFPDFNVLRPGANLQALMASDLVGISRFAGISLSPFPSKLDPNPELIPMSTIDAVYTNYGALVWINNANGLGLSFNMFPKESDNEDVRNAWVSAIVAYPSEYIRYRLDIFGAIIGTTVDRTYEPTHFATIDANDLGIVFTKMPLTDPVLGYIWETSGNWLFMPVMIWFSATILAASTLVRRVRAYAVSRVGLVIYLLGLVYLIPYMFIVGTGEVRYAYPSVVMFVLSAALGLEGLRRSIKANKDLLSGSVGSAERG
jgi:hypothetical protein